MNGMTVFKRILLLLICTVFSISCAAVCSSPTKAAASLSASASVNGSTVTVTVTFPDVAFKAGTFEVSFNPAHLQLSQKGTTDGLSHAMITTTEVADANAGGFCRFAIMDFTAPVSAKGGMLTMVFSVKDASVTSTSVTVTVVNCGNGSDSPVELGGTSKTIVLKESSISTGTSTNTSSSITSSTNTSSSGSTNTGTPSNIDTSTSIKPTNTSTNSSTKTDSVTSDTGSESNSDTEETQTESGDSLTDSLIGSETGEDTVADSSVGGIISSVSSENRETSSRGSISSSGLGGGHKMNLSSAAVAAISFAVAAFLCCLFTLIGFLRHKKNTNS